MDDWLQFFDWQMHATQSTAAQHIRLDSASLFHMLLCVLWCGQVLLVSPVTLQPTHCDRGLPLYCLAATHRSHKLDLSLVVRPDATLLGLYFVLSFMDGKRQAFDPRLHLVVQKSLFPLSFWDPATGRRVSQPPEALKGEQASHWLQVWPGGTCNASQAVP